VPALAAVARRLAVTRTRTCEIVVSYHGHHARVLGDAADDAAFQSMISSLRKDQGYTGGAKPSSTSGGTSAGSGSGALMTGLISAGGALIGGLVRGADARTGGGTGPAEDPAFSTVPSFITPDATAPSSALPGWAIPVAAAAGIGIVALMTVALLKKRPVAKNRKRARCAS
jgi:hypothetical protein